MGLGLDVSRVAAVYEHFERVERGRLPRTAHARDDHDLRSPYGRRRGRRHARRRRLRAHGRLRFALREREAGIHAIVPKIEAWNLIGSIESLVAQKSRPQAQ